MAKESDMSELVLTDIVPVLLTCQIHGDSMVCAHERGVLPGDPAVVELGDLPSTHVRIADFQHDGVRYLTNVATVREDGTLESWPRHDGYAESPELRAGDRVVIMNVLIDAIGYDTVEPSSARNRSEGALAVFQHDIAIDVRKKGSKPTP